MEFNEGRYCTRRLTFEWKKPTGGYDAGGAYSGCRPIAGIGVTASSDISSACCRARSSLKCLRQSLMPSPGQAALASPPSLPISIPIAVWHWPVGFAVLRAGVDGSDTTAQSPARWSPPLPPAGAMCCCPDGKLHAGGHRNFYRK